MLEVTLELWSWRGGSAHTELGVEHKGVKGLGGRWRRGRLGGRREGGVFAYVATLPRANADTDHSRQMKSLLFLKSSRQGAAMGFLL